VGFGARCDGSGSVPTRDDESEAAAGSEPGLLGDSDTTEMSAAHPTRTHSDLRRDESLIYTAGETVKIPRDRFFCTAAERAK